MPKTVGETVNNEDFEKYLDVVSLRQHLLRTFLFNGKIYGHNLTLQLNLKL